MAKDDQNELAYRLSNCLNISAISSHLLSSNGFYTSTMSRGRSRGSSTSTVRALEVKQIEKEKSPVEKLPAEILADIFMELHTHSARIHAIRLTCSAFLASAWKAFGHTFNHKIFHLSKASLACLAELVAEEGAAVYVTTLNLSTVEFINPANSSWIFRGHSGQETSERWAADQQSMALVAADVKFERSGDLQVQLARVLRGLRSLETINVVHEPEMSKTPRIPGLKPAHQEVLDRAYRDQHLELYELHAHHRTLSHLVGVSDGAGLYKRLRSLSIEYSIDLGSLPRSAYLGESPSSTHPPAFESLQKLTLHLSESTHPLWMQQDRAAFLPNFLLGCPNLTHLSITIPPPGRTRGRFSHQSIYGDDGFRRFAAVTFPHLTSWHFSGLCIHSITDLFFFLAKHAKSLKDLALLNLVLQEVEWIPLTDFLRTRLELQTFDFHYTWSEEQMAVFRVVRSEFTVPRAAWSTVAKSVRWQCDQEGAADREAHLMPESER